MHKSLWVLILVLLATQTAFAATPQNPLLVDHELYVSHNGVHKFNRDTLEPVWSSITGVQTFELVMGDTLLYVGSPQGLYAINPDNGEIAWHIEDTRSIFSPVVAEQLYAGSLHGTLYSINPVNGSIIWRQLFDGWIYSPAVLPEQGQLWTGGQAHMAYAVAIDDGHKLHGLALGQESIFSPSSIGRHQVAFNLFNGDTTIINAKTAGIEVILDGVTQPKDLSFDDKLIYRSTHSGDLAAFDRDSYQLRWQKSMVSAELTIHPGINEYLLLSDLDKTLILVNRHTAAEVWRGQLNGSWFLPIQVDQNAIIYFKPINLQPNVISAVKIDAQLTN
jgi:outer membrane protein assembly factor BamB